MNYSDNYLNISLVTYTPKLKQFRNHLMLSQEDKNHIATKTNDSALRLYEYYIDKRGWKHFNPTDYERIANDLQWSKAKTEKTKTMLIKAGLLLILKDTLKDKSIIYRVLLGENIIDIYNKTGEFPELSGSIDGEVNQNFEGVLK